MPGHDAFLRRWRITWMDAWDQAFVDEEEEGYVRFDRNGAGEFHFGYVHGQMTCDLTERNGRPAVEWTWAGNDEMDEAGGRGWAFLRDDGTLRGTIVFHSGGQSAFEAEARDAAIARRARAMHVVRETPPPPDVDLAYHRALRSLLRGHQNAAADTVTRSALRRSARRFGLLEGGQLCVETNDEVTILIDHLVYDVPSHGRTPVRRYLDKLPRTGDADEQLIRSAMAGARFSLFEIAAVHSPGLWLHDLVRGGELIFSVDEAMSGSIVAGARIASRVLQTGRWWMPSGGGFPVSDVLVDEVLDDVLPLILPATAGRPVSMTERAAQELAEHVLAIGFADGSTGRIEMR